MRLARSVTTCSVAAPAGTITHATRGGRSARTKSSSAVVPVAPSLGIAWPPAGSDAYPTISWPPRIKRRAMLAPIRPSPTIPTCMESSSRLEGRPSRASPAFTSLPRCTRSARRPRSWRPSRRPPANELANGPAVRHEDRVGGGEEEARVDDAGDRKDRPLEGRRVLDRTHRAVDDHVEVVGHERTLLVRPQRGLQSEVLEPPPAEGERERHDLHREPATSAESLDQLVGGHEDDLPPGRRGDDPFPHERSAIALDEVQLPIDLVGAVDGEVQLSLEANEADAELPGEARRLLGRRYAPDTEPVAHGRGEGADERAGRAAGAEADDDAVPDEVEGARRKRREWIAGRCRHDSGRRPTTRIPLSPPAGSSGFAPSPCARSRRRARSRRSAAN